MSYNPIYEKAREILRTWDIEDLIGLFYITDCLSGMSDKELLKFVSDNGLNER